MASIRDLVSSPEEKDEVTYSGHRKTDNRYDHPTEAPPQGRRESSSSSSSSSFAQPPHPPHQHPHYYDHHQPLHHPGTGYPYPPPLPPGTDYPHYPYHQPPHGSPYHGYPHPSSYPLPPLPGHGYPHPPPHGYPPAAGGSSSPSSSAFRSPEERPGPASPAYQPLAPKHASHPYPSEGRIHQHPIAHAPGNMKNDQAHPPHPRSNSNSLASSRPPPINPENEEEEQRRPAVAAAAAELNDSRTTAPADHTQQHHDDPPSSVSTTSASKRSALDHHRRFRIKIVQEPLHARMCGFGEKDRRPIDPPPIVQLIMVNDDEEDCEEEGSSNASRQRRGSMRHRGSGSKAKKKSISEQWICNDLPPKLLASSRRIAAASLAAAGNSSPLKHQDGSSQSKTMDKHYEGAVNGSVTASGAGGDVEMTDVDGPGHGHSAAFRGPVDSSSSSRRRQSSDRHDSISHDEGDDEEHDELDEDDAASSHARDAFGGEEDGGEDGDDDDDDVGFLQQDPLFVLHASLWSEDGSQVRSMIATPGQQDPPKLTRILMGSIVVSPILLNNPQGEPGWYFSFPDLSIRTEGVYTLKFSLLRFGSFNFNVEEGGQHASDVIDEAISQPFTVFSAKKFPGMTESTELSKTFAKQGLKIPIRNDLRVRKADRD